MKGRAMAEHDFGCSGKVGYRFRSDAVRSKKAQRNPGDRTGRARKLHIYHCNYCGLFHLSSLNKSRSEIDEVRVETEIDRAWRIKEAEDGMQ